MGVNSERSQPTPFSRGMRLIALLLLVTVAAAIGGYQLFQYLNRSPLREALNTPKPFGILLVGEQATEGRKETLFIGVATLYPKTYRIGIVSLFTETQLTKKENSLGKRLVKGSLEKVQEDLSNLLSIKIPYHIRIEPKDVVRLIDLIEGVPYFLWQHNTLEEEKLPQGEFILEGSIANRLLSGKVTSEGGTAFQLFRYYSLMLNLWEVRNQKWKILSHPSVFQYAAKEVKTNLSTQELYTLSESLLATDSWLPLFLELPVKRIKDSFVLDAETTALYLKQFRENLTKKKPKFLKEPPKVEIKNGTHVANLAQQTRARLRRKGMRVLEFTNADRHDYQESMLLDISASPHYLKSAGRALGVKDTYHAINRGQFTDLILILGKDYEELNVAP